MRHDVRFAVRAEHREQRQAAGDGQPRAATPTLALELQPAEQADRAEYRGRRAPRAVMSPVEERVEDVAPCAGREHQPAAEARPERAADGGHEDRARDRVAEEVGRVGVQREGRHRAPPLAAHDQLGRGDPGPGPRAARVRRPRDAVEADEQHGHEKPGVGRAVLRHLLARRRVSPLGIVRVQRGDGPVGVACGHEETPAARVAGDAMGDAGGGEDEGPLLDGAPPGGGAERVLLLAHRIPPRTSGILRRMPPTPRRIEPGPGQESVWDYPRPPRVEGCDRRLRVVFNGCVVGETTRALRVLETSQPPAYYFPPEDVRLATFFTRTHHTTLCRVEGRRAPLHHRGRRPYGRERRLVLPGAGPGLRDDRGPRRLLPGARGCLLRRRRAGAGTGRRLLRRLDHARRDRTVRGRTGCGGLVGSPFRPFSSYAARMPRPARLLLAALPLALLASAATPRPPHPPPPLEPRLPP